MAGLDGLTPQQREILHLLASDMDNREIAFVIGISHRGVQELTTGALAACGLSDRSEVAAYLAQQITESP